MISSQALPLSSSSFSHGRSTARAASAPTPRPRAAAATPRSRGASAPTTTPVAARAHAGVDRLEANPYPRFDTDGARANFVAAGGQYQRLLTRLPDASRSPRSADPTGALTLVPPSDWTSGFFPGSLWLLHEQLPDQGWDAHARRFTEVLENEQHTRSNHDVGFMMFSSYGHGLRLTGEPRYAEVLLTTADSLATRFDPRVGCIRSWDWGRWKYPVIIDNLMNLELLFWAAKQDQRPRLAEIAVSHLEKTDQNHFRADASSYHVVDYDPETGGVLQRQTFQGHSDASAWSRGQGWGLYGYTMAFRETGETRYLERAQEIAEFIANHPRLPEDSVPYWDFDAPNIPEAPRDTAAGAVIASALFELRNYVAPEASTRYLGLANDILRSLSAAPYRAERPGDHQDFILGHAVGSLPHGLEVDRPLNYADYYFLEASQRRLALEPTLG